MIHPKITLPGEKSTHTHTDYSAAIGSYSTRTRFLDDSDVTNGKECIARFNRRSWGSNAWRILRKVCGGGNAGPWCRSFAKEFVHAFSCASIELWMHSGSLDSTQVARGAFALCNFYASFVLSKPPACDIGTLSMNKFLNILTAQILTKIAAVLLLDRHIYMKHVDSYRHEFVSASLRFLQWRLRDSNSFPIPIFIRHLSVS